MLGQQVLYCDIKDNAGLNDFQKLPDRQGIAIPKVGISRLRLPLTFKHSDGYFMGHDCEASMYLNLAAGKTGINMSRLVKILQEEGMDHFVNTHFLKSVLNRYRHELKDSEKDEPFKQAFLKIQFSYPMKQKSLKSNNWGWQYYPATLQAKQTGENKFEVFITVEYEYSSTCPCSLSMAKQYEREFKAGLTTEGNGIAAAHSQRSKATCKIQIDPQSDFFLEDLVQHMRTAIPTETQSLVKRVDEQAFAILNGENPMFVEHASKRLFKTLNSDARILDWIVTLEHFESLHSHNAVAVINKGIAGGLEQDHLFS
ncbi:MAG: GTP cyclohydrolase I FolE2 [Bacteriovoracaceae bacterium]|nr:GTP cyclohydrolase I FolE2 [Bacteriovoracaceae bacterium]